MADPEEQERDEPLDDDVRGADDDEFEDEEEEESLDVGEREIGHAEWRTR